MPNEPSGVGVWTPKIADEALVRKFLSLGGQGYVAISIQNGATSVDPDANTLNLAIWFNDVLTAPSATNPYGTQVATVAADAITRTDVGKFYYDIGPGLTANRGLVTAIWTYQVAGVAFQFTDHLQILDPMPLYDTLDDQERSVVEQVSWQFGDLYDSTEGGPHLMEEFQTHWGYERIAQMMAIAVQKMNYLGNFGNAPTAWSVGNLGNSGFNIPGQQVTNTQTMPDGTVLSTTYTTRSSQIGGGSGIPSSMYGLTIWGTYVECLRHFRDSYTELPARPGMDAVYTDRRDYWSRWNSNLQAEETNYRTAVTQAKMANLSLSRGSLLVAGGIYGGSALGVFQYGTYAAQVRSFRFYPAAPAISWGATAH